MLKHKSITYICVGCLALVLNACAPDLVQKQTKLAPTPETYSESLDTTNSAIVNWHDYFTDPNLVALIDTALKNNQELNIILQKINIAQNDIRARKGAYLPNVDLGVGAGVEKAGRYTRNGAVDENVDIKPGQAIPDPLTNLSIGAEMSWEVDIWKKLRNAKKVALYKYLASVEGKNYMVTSLVAEIAGAYYELMALDNQLEILKQNIEIQNNAVKVVDMQKSAGMVTELAVRRFHAEVSKNQSRQYYLEQQIIEAQNKINFLVGRFPQEVVRSSSSFSELEPIVTYSGLPSQLLENRPDIRQAEQELAAAKLDIKVAKAHFYPSFKIKAGLGYEAFNPEYLLSTPTSLLYNAAGSLVAPVINRNAIKATYLNANAKQIQAAYDYERTVLNAYTEVVNQQAKIQNLANSYEFKTQQVESLNRSIDISLTLFNQARADYVEVLLTQRDALDAKMELVETKKQQLEAMVKMYQALGGGWQQ